MDDKLIVQLARIVTPGFTPEEFLTEKFSGTSEEVVKKSIEVLKTLGDLDTPELQQVLMLTTFGMLRIPDILDFQLKIQDLVKSLLEYCSSHESAQKNELESLF